MEWVTLGTWILVVMLALPAARVPLPSLGVSALCALAGLGAMILFVATDATGWGWVAFGCACIGTVTGAEGARVLVIDAKGTTMGASQGHVELSAGLEGAALPLFAVAIVVSLAIGAG